MPRKSLPIACIGFALAEEAGVAQGVASVREALAAAAPVVATARAATIEELARSSS